MKVIAHYNVANTLQAVLIEADTLDQIINEAIKIAEKYKEYKDANRFILEDRLTLGTYYAIGVRSNRKYRDYTVKSWTIQPIDNDAEPIAEPYLHPTHTTITPRRAA
jgi:hypothetical protein